MSRSTIRVSMSLFVGCWVPLTIRDAFPLDHLISSANAEIDGYLENTRPLSVVVISYHLLNVHSVNLVGHIIPKVFLHVNHKMNILIDFLFTLCFNIHTCTKGDLIMSDTLFSKDRFREAMGDMTVIDLADRLGCPKSSVSMYLSGQRVPSKMAIQLIALNLGVNPAWLCGLDVPKE